jgi:hypothetical protein
MMMLLEARALSFGLPIPTPPPPGGTAFRPRHTPATTPAPLRSSPRVSRARAFGKEPLEIRLNATPRPRHAGFFSSLAFAHITTP